MKMPGFMDIPLIYKSLIPYYEMTLKREYEAK